MNSAAGKLLLLMFAARLAAVPWQLAAENFFSFDNRVFSRAEAEMITGKSTDLQQAVILHKIPVAVMTLCERSGIKLSQDETRRSLQENFMIMSPEAREGFNRQLEQEGSTAEQWIQNESAKFSNQLNDAVRRWYIKVYGNRQEITREHIRNWYYRNQNIFRRLRLDPAKIWVFEQNDQESMQKALAALRQGMMPTEVRKKYALHIPEKEIANELHSPGLQRQIPEPGYVVMTGRKHRFLMQNDAAVTTYIKLDEKLEKAIGNALYDALAKARLEIVLKEYMQNKEISFF